MGNQLVLSYFAVTVNNSGITDTAPGDGFIDNTTIEQYAALATPTVPPTPIPNTLALSQAKTRANLRWQEILQQVGLYNEPVYTLDITAAGADANTEATSFTCTLVFDRPEFFYVLDTVANDGTYLTGADAIKRCIAIALTNTINHKAVVIDPTAIAGLTEYQGFGESVQYITAGPLFTSITLAEDQITVAAVPNT